MRWRQDSLRNARATMSAPAATACNHLAANKGFRDNHRPGQLTATTRHISDNSNSSNLPTALMPAVRTTRSNGDRLASEASAAPDTFAIGNVANCYHGFVSRGFQRPCVQINHADLVSTLYRDLNELPAKTRSATYDKHLHVVDLVQEGICQDARIGNRPAINRHSPRASPGSCSRPLQA